jgi:hypothetical protein
LKGFGEDEPNDKNIFEGESIYFPNGRFLQACLTKVLQLFVKKDLTMDGEFVARCDALLELLEIVSPL